MNNAYRIVCTTTKEVLFCCLLLAMFLSACNTQDSTENESKSPEKEVVAKAPATYAPTQEFTTRIQGNIYSILQDKQGNYWFCTNGFGVYRYDGHSLIRFTDKEGLSNNQVHSIQEDSGGNLWFRTGYGISIYNGKSFTSYIRNKTLPAKFTPARQFQNSPTDIWIEGEGGMYRHHEGKFSYFSLPYCPIDAKKAAITPGSINEYTVYYTYKDRNGGLWFGTQNMGVCYYNGKKFEWFTAEGLSGPAVRSIYEDRNGNMWFGNNGNGLLKWDGKTLINITDAVGLRNEAFVKGHGLRDMPGTLARVWAINEDSAGDLWIGTIDAGVWRYNGKFFTNYTQKDGLTSLVINTIYKDNSGRLLFGTDTGIFRFDGKSFVRFI